LLTDHFQNLRFRGESADVVLNADKHAGRFAGLAEDEASFLPVGFADQLVELCRCLCGRDYFSHTLPR